MKRLQTQKSLIEESTHDQKNQISDLKKMLIQQNEQKAKSLKECDKAAITAIKKTMAAGISPSVGVGRSILDRICQLASGKEGASFAVEGSDIF
jgi:mannose/fructose/N-acetylgalactosamine-specific phosphotransferase system component IID